MVNAILGFIIGCLVGLLLGYLASLRTRARNAQEDEFERINRLKMRHFIAEVAPPCSNILRTISPGFRRIYSQAKDADVYKLDQVAGIAYGKSLEFLLKDYAKFEHPERSEEIERCPLGRCIKDHITDPSIRNSGELAAWLRNDEAHYVRKFAEQDVQSLKKLIDSIIKLIENAAERKNIDEETSRLRASMTR